MNLICLKSPNFNKTERISRKIRFLVIHYTGMQSLRASIKRLMNTKHKVSCHYLVSREGKIYQMVKDNHVAWHAGKSKWGKIKNLNSSSIGIELENRGHQYGYQKFSKKQINLLIKLCRKLKSKYRIKNYFILGHSDIAPLRKFDPGEKFPWQKFGKKKIGIWYNLKKNKFKLKKNSIKGFRNLFFNNLHKIGYRYFDKNKSLKTDSLVIKAFQRRFRQKKIDGLIDLECIKISANLAKKC